MEKKFKAFRVAALLSVMGGASALLLSAATPAKAGEERLHSSSFAVYGLIPPGENTKDNASNKHTSKSDPVKTASVSSLGSPRSGAKSAPSNEPKLEDPPMPSYDGPSAGGNTMASNDAGPGSIAN